MVARELESWQTGTTNFCLLDLLKINTFILSDILFAVAVRIWYVLSVFLAMLFSTVCFRYTRGVVGSRTTRSQGRRVELLNLVAVAALLGFSVLAVVLSVIWTWWNEAFVVFR